MMNTLFPRYKNQRIPDLDDFNLEKKLGEGNYGYVWKYVHKTTGLAYAIKKIKIPKMKREIIMVQKQIEILYKIDNQYIVGLVDHFQTQEDVYLIMEFINGKDLFKSVFTPKKKLQLKFICKIVYEVCLALQELHKHNIIHRDLKLQNIIYLSNNSIKIVDLGCSNYYGEDIQRLTSIGTKPYWSPELLSGDGQDDRLDVWCLGVILYQLIFLSSPFNEPDMIIKIRQLQYDVPQALKQDEELLDLFKSIFAYKPKRIRAHQVRQHPFIVRHYQPEKQTQKFQQFFPEQKVNMYKKYLLEQIQIKQQQIQKLKNDNQIIEEKLRSSKQFFQF